MTHGGLRHIFQGKYSQGNIFTTEDGHQIDISSYDSHCINPELSQINEVTEVDDELGGILLYVGKIS